MLLLLSSTKTGSAKCPEDSMPEGAAWELARIYMLSTPLTRLIHLFSDSLTEDGQQEDSRRLPDHVPSLSVLETFCFVPTDLFQRV